MYSYTPLYYSAPTQVRYWEEERYHGGIGYHDIIIKGGTGEVIAIQTIIDNAQKESVNWDEAIIELDWNDIDEEILWNKRYRHTQEV